jgi:putative acetyltransferase
LAGGGVFLYISYFSLRVALFFHLLKIMLKFSVHSKAPSTSTGGLLNSQKRIYYRSKNKITTSIHIQNNNKSALMTSLISIERVDPNNATQIEEFRLMTRKYLEWLGVDLGFQGIDTELASLPGNYHPDARGCMLLAYESSTENGNSTPPLCIGAVALRPLTGQHTDTITAIAGIETNHICEMKRLFVLESHQGQGAGTQLTIAITQAAKDLGYKAMVLDTLERLSGANKVYKNQGFELCDRYNDCPLPGVLYFMKKI